MVICQERGIFSREDGVDRPAICDVSQVRELAGTLRGVKPTRPPIWFVVVLMCIVLGFVVFVGRG